MVVIGGKTYLVKKLKEKLNLNSEMHCGKELDALTGCMEYFDGKSNECMGFLARYDVCVSRGAVIARRTKRAHTNFGYKVNEIARLASKLKLR